MSICMIQENSSCIFKATLCAPTVQLKKYPNVEFGVWNGAELQGSGVVKCAGDRTYTSGVHNGK
jgi:hypothetical protein